jgi:hypothetical protein
VLAARGLAWATARRMVSRAAPVFPALLVRVM